MPSGAAVAKSYPAGDIAQSGAKKKSFRPDIQGLRTIAVVVVILEHLFGWPHGGFVGVDIFFVISGFLITGLLIRERERSGRISFAGFYRRRVKRIIPIATLVILVTVVASYLVYLPTRANAILVDGVWALFFAANWHFAAEGTDYWAADGTISPLQHYWSLAVEEQFYVVWPWIIIIVIGIAATRSWSHGRGRVVLFTAMGVLTLASFGFALWQTIVAPNFAYFSTMVRAWELGVGALLAVGASSFVRIPARLRPLLAWVGIAGILAAIVVTPSSPGFPAPWAALPVFATALVIASGTGGEQRYLFPLTNRVSVYLGDISFSLYLWHFPLVVLLLAVIPDQTVYYAAVLGGTLLLSVLSYHLIEDPIRTSSWLEPKDPNRSRSRRYREPLEAGRASYIFLAVGGVVALTLVAFAAQPAATLPGASVTYAPSSTPSASASAAEPETVSSELARQISAAASATAFPVFDPGIDSLGTKNWVEQVAGGGCADISAKTLEGCVTGSGDLDVAVFGDSYAIAWLPAVRSALESQGYRVWPFTRGECPAALVGVTKSDGGDFPVCAEHQDWAIGAINELQPDLIIVASADNTLQRLASGAEGSEAVAEFQQGMEYSLDALAVSGARIVDLAPPPGGVALQQCVTRTSGPDDCLTTITSLWKSFAGAQKSAAEATGTEFIDTKGWFCTASGACPGFVGTTPVRADASHLTQAYSASLGPVLASSLITSD